MSRHRNLKEYLDDYDDYKDVGALDDDEEDGVDFRKTINNNNKKQQPVKKEASVKLTTVNSNSNAEVNPNKGSLEIIKPKSSSSSSTTATLVQLQDGVKQKKEVTLLAQSIQPIVHSKEQTAQEREREREILLNGKLGTKSPIGFDFSSPSPDDVVLMARKREGKREPLSQVQSALSDLSLEKKSEEPIAIINPAVEIEEEENQTKPLVNLVVVGHVDAGKSTLMGHFLYAMKIISQKEMHKHEKESKDLGKASFKFAFVMDEHLEERERGVTIDVGIKRFETMHRRIMLLDAPGHKDFVPNMITGAAQADASILVIPSTTGEFESAFGPSSQTREHAILVNRLGVGSLIVCVNKMDTVNFAKERFDEVKEKVGEFLRRETSFSGSDVVFIPCSGLTGENLTTKSAMMDWYTGDCLLDAIDKLPGSKRPLKKPLRIVISDVYKSMLLGGVTVSGKVEAGFVKVGDSVILCPMKEMAIVKSLSSHGQLIKRAAAGENVEIGLDKFNGDVTKIGNGVILCDPKNKPVQSTSEMRLRIQTLSAMKFPILNGSTAIMHLHSTEVPIVVVKIEKLVASFAAEGAAKDDDNKKPPRFVKRNESAEILIKASWAICVDKFEDFKPLGRVLLRMDGVTIAAGIVL